MTACPAGLPRTALLHLTVWVIYAVLILRLYLNLKRAGEGGLAPPLLMAMAA